MRINKEALIKQHFWVLLGVYTPMIFLAIILLWTTVADAVESKSNDLEKIKKDLEGAKLNGAKMKNEKWSIALKKKGDELVKHKNAVWKEAYDAQKDMFTWPNSMIQADPTLKNKPFGAILDTKLWNTYVDEDDGYKKEVDNIIDVVQPITADGKGVVQFKNHNWESVIAHVKNWHSDEAKKVHNSEEIWLAQEDLWVQRELLRLVRETNDFVAILKKDANSPKPDHAGKKELDHKIFLNPYWKLELILMQDKLKRKLTNIGDREQKLALRFLVKLTDDPKLIEVFIDGEPLAPNQSTEETVESLNTVIVNKEIEHVEQVLDGYMAPVKRIDKIMLGVQPAQSHRTSAMDTLKPLPAPTADKAGAAASKAAPPSGKPQGGGETGMMAPPGVGVNRMGAASDGSSKTVNFLERNRYFDVTPQARRMPVGMVMIVDQSHVQDVLTSFANSKLRIQVTQVQWQHVWPSREKSGRGADPSSRPSLPRGFVMPDGGKKPNAPGDRPSPSEEATNVVELTVYGIASLYENPEPASSEKTDSPQNQPTAATSTPPGAPAKR